MTQESALELTRQNAELTARVAELTQALAQAEAFTKLNAGVVHDLRNAFQVTLMAAETLVLAVHEPDDRELVESIVAAAQHGALLARDLLAVAGSEGARASSVDVAESLARLRRFIQRFALQKIECSFEIDLDVWPIMVERQKLDAALINLCVNARDAMPRGGRLVDTAILRSGGSGMKCDTPPDTCGADLDCRSPLICAAASCESLDGPE
jgi:signal transduction histidine kinase